MKVLIWHITVKSGQMCVCCIKDVYYVNLVSGIFKPMKEGFSMFFIFYFILFLKGNYCVFVLMIVTGYNLKINE